MEKVLIRGLIIELIGRINRVIRDSKEATTKIPDMEKIAIMNIANQARKFVKATTPSRNIIPKV